MGVEIERKFLVKDESYKKLSNKQIKIQQGYLNRDPERTVRVRTCDSRGFVTIKGKTVGTTRLEFEYEVPLQDAQKMLALCIPPILSKTRYIVVGTDQLIWEVDEFHGDRAGLTVAEIELNKEDQLFSIPYFIGIEVTGDPRFYNSNL